MFWYWTDFGVSIIHHHPGPKFGSNNKQKLVGRVLQLVQENWHFDGHNVFRTYPYLPF